MHSYGAAWLVTEPPQPVRGKKRVVLACHLNAHTASEWEFLALAERLVALLLCPKVQRLFRIISVVNLNE